MYRIGGHYDGRAPPSGESMTALASSHLQWSQHRVDTAVLKTTHRPNVPGATMAQHTMQQRLTLRRVKSTYPRGSASFGLI